MSAPMPPPKGRLGALLRAPMAWIAVVVLIVVVAATAAVAVELFASTSEPMVVNPR